jgi:hypothetical protein
MRCINNMFKVDPWTLTWYYYVGGICGYKTQDAERMCPMKFVLMCTPCHKIWQACHNKWPVDKFV